MPEVAATSTATVLVVDDEPHCRHFLALTLRQAGHSVLLAGDGIEALQVSDGYDGTIHVVFSDVVMPGMGGRELVEKLLKKRPQTRVVFISGYVDDPLLRTRIEQAQFSLLQKPFTAAEAIQAVHEAMR